MSHKKAALSDIRSAYKSGMTTRELADKLGYKDAEYLARRCNQIGITFKKVVPQQDKDRIVALYHAGVDYKILARVFSVSDSMVHYYVRKARYVSSE